MSPLALSRGPALTRAPARRGHPPYVELAKHAASAPSLAHHFCDSRPVLPYISRSTMEQLKAYIDAFASIVPRLETAVDALHQNSPPLPLTDPPCRRIALPGSRRGCVSASTAWRRALAARRDAAHHSALLRDVVKTADDLAATLRHPATAVVSSGWGVRFGSARDNLNAVCSAS